MAELKILMVSPKANVLQSQTPDGVRVYLIDREDFFDRPNLYGNNYGDYYDNLEPNTSLDG